MKKKKKLNTELINASDVPQYQVGEQFTGHDSVKYTYVKVDKTFGWIREMNEQTFQDYLGWGHDYLLDTDVEELKKVFMIHCLHERVHMTAKDIRALGPDMFRALLKQPISKVGAAMKHMNKTGDDKTIDDALKTIPMGEGEGEGEEESEPQQREQTPEQQQAKEELEKQLRAAMAKTQDSIRQAMQKAFEDVAKKSEEINIEGGKDITVEIEFEAEDDNFNFFDDDDKVEQKKPQKKKQQEDAALKLHKMDEILEEKANERVKEMIEEALAPIQAPLESTHVLGQHYKYPLVLKCISCNDVNVALVGPAGSGKTRLVEEIAKALELHFSPQSFNCLSSKADILGFVDANGSYHASVFRERFEYGGVFLADEFDACHPGVATILNAAIANKLCTFGDNKTIRAHDDFKAVMCMNTFGTGPSAEYVGRNRLDAATLDRFAFIYLDYDEVLEFSMIGVAQKPIEFDVGAGGIIPKEGWILEVQKIRDVIKKNKMRMIVSPRATIMGAELSDVGIGVEHLRELLIYKGISENDREQLLELMKPFKKEKKKEKISEDDKYNLAQQIIQMQQEKQRVQNYQEIKLAPPGLQEIGNYNIRNGLIKGEWQLK